ncbi:MAG: multifunctional CCA tRNA nucleotidyl transferase/2'3'-cyclic phosphodiesterase/2'nucleotidase/phosphatase [Betaproteobacteria bacterium]|nr:multifunctional CCA tRNA nucleotidyl transferase/2'3'-cyclic phosphodiesterase/2'nucleotidase/phosphatase [Betaproteobacteria bacterium]
MRIYTVGGAVRDELLGWPVTDRDHVVVGATPGQMIELGYKPVGKDFPVFLHPKTHEEYALARTERKTARGYHGFEFHAAPDVTLEQDLARRDLTINAIAKDEAGNIIDPFGGGGDLKARVLRHVGPAFVEDPVRILRVARFAARLDFAIAPETLALMRRMVDNGEADALVAERVWQELTRGLMESHPPRMFRALAECGALPLVLPELAGQFVGAAGRHTSTVLAAAAVRGLGLAERFALIAMRADEAAISGLCERLRVPQDCRELALLAARYHADIEKAAALQAGAVLWLLQATDALRRPERFTKLLEVCTVDKMGSAAGSFPAAERLRTALTAAQSVDAGAIAKQSREPRQIRERIAQARTDTIRRALGAELSTKKRTS